MIRTADDWYKFVINRGTSGDMVFDILADWREERRMLLNDLDELKKELEESNSVITQTVCGS